MSAEAFSAFHDPPIDKPAMETRPFGFRTALYAKMMPGKETGQRRHQWAVAWYCC